MSLMLNALKRIEAKQASARAAVVQPCAPAPHFTVAEPIEVPPELTADHGTELTAEQVALPDGVFWETAISDLSDLLAEAKLLDLPHEPRVRSTGFSRKAEDIPPESEAASELPEIPWDQEEPDAGTASAEPPVVQPLGTDPYAATAWQIVKQLPRGRSQVLLFTSPNDGHGKTITLARLLPHFPRSFSGSILAVDANTCNPDLARWLEVAATWRLTDVLAGATHWINAVRATALPQVSLLPGGSDASRLNVRGKATLLRELAAHYDLVLVDASSLAHEGAAQLAAACDGTYLVVRLGEGSRRMVREAVRVIDRAGGRLLGCIAIDAGA